MTGQLALFHAPRVEPLCHDGAGWCFACGVDTLEIDEWYMVRGEVWRAAVPWNADGEMFDFRCVGCLEDRIGRLLVASDFTDVPVNTFCGSPRLQARREAATRTCGCGCGASLDGRRANVNYLDEACRVRPTEPAKPQPDPRHGLRAM